MKLIRSHAKNILLVLIGASLILASCSQQDETPQDATAYMRSSYTGEELFKAVMFGYGEFATKLSFYDEQTKQYEEGKMMKEEQFIERFKAFSKRTLVNNPKFFDEFKKNIESGDPYVTEEALRTGYSEIHKNLDILFPELLQVMDSFDRDSRTQSILAKDEKDVTAEDREYLTAKAQEYMEMASPCSPLFCVFYFALAVHNTGAVTANLYVYLGYKLWGPKLSSYKGGRSVSFNRQADNLQFELLIKDITTAVK